MLRQRRNNCLLLIFVGDRELFEFCALELCQTGTEFTAAFVAIKVD